MRDCRAGFNKQTYYEKTIANVSHSYSLKFADLSNGIKYADNGTFDHLNGISTKYILNRN